MKYESRFLLSLLKRIILVLFISILWFFISDIIFTVNDEPLKPTEIIIVLGNPVNDDGTIGTTQKSRVDAGIELYRKGLAKQLLFTGGAVANQFVEAEVMKTYAIGLGVPDLDIIVETKSINTIENARFSNQILQIENIKSAIVVTSSYHTLRTKKIFAAYNITVQIKAVPYPILIGFLGRLQAIAHEYAAWLYYSVYGIDFRKVD